jgi:RND superfamily putative drug exporter
MEETHTQGGWRPGRIAGWYARWVVRLRWFVVALWLAAVGAAVAYLPAIGSGGDLSQLVSSDNPAVQAEINSVNTFGYPLLSRVAVVQRDPGGLSRQTQARAVQRAAAVDRGEYNDIAPILAAVAVPNTLGLFPGSREKDTTVITLIYTSPDVTLADQLEAARRFVARHFDASDHVVGVTGSVPARVEQGRLIIQSVPLIEAATVIAVIVIVAIAYRSVVASVVTVVVASTAVLLTLHLADTVGHLFGVEIPTETEPLLVALLLGVVTDYVVFYLSGMRMQLAAGAGGRAAAQWATARFTPIIATAAAIVAAGTGALLVARSAVFRAFGPGMAAAVLIAMLVSVTLMPALLAILGRVALWPGRRAVDSRDRSGRTTIWSWLLTRRLIAAVILVGCVGGLVYAALPVRHLALGLPWISSLPADNSVRQAAVQAQTGFAKGILSPTELVVRAPGLTGRRAALDRLQHDLARRPGVAGVLGPEDQVIPMEHDLFLTGDGTAARYLLILADDPLDARGIATLSRLQADLPRMLAAAGLPGAQTGFAGDTAVARYIVDQTAHDLGRIAVVALGVNLLILVLFLRALVAPLCLLASSVLAIGTTLGLTTWLFQDVLGEDGITFYVPFVAAVLLIALGSDYNVFAVGHAWEEARRRPLREALAATLPQSARTIRTAGVTLAISLGLLTIVPLHPFREIAFAMAAGILIDALVVRSLVVPSVLALVGSASGCPGRRLVRRRWRARVGDEIPVAVQSAPDRYVDQR